jgi:hypothetical protein
MACSNHFEETNCHFVQAFLGPLILIDFQQSSSLDIQKQNVIKMV